MTEFELLPAATLERKWARADVLQALGAAGAEPTAL